MSETDTDDASPIQSWEDVYSFGIDRAKEKGDGERAQRLYQRQMGVDPDDPDKPYDPAAVPESDEGAYEGEPEGEEYTDDELDEFDAAYAEETEKTLRYEWEDAYDGKVEAAQLAVREIFGEDHEGLRHLEDADGNYVFDHPAIVKLAALAGENMTADPLEKMRALPAPPDGPWDFGRPEVVRHQFKIMEATFGEPATKLKNEWGRDGSTNMQFAKATAVKLEAAYPGIDAVIRKYGAQNDPLVIDAFAMMGRYDAATVGDPATVQPFRNTNESKAMTEGNIQAQIEALQGDIDKARAQRNSSLANDLYQRQLMLGRRLPGGTDPASSGTAIR